MISYQPEFDLAEELYTPEEVKESIRRGIAQAEAGEVEEMPWVTIDESSERGMEESAGSS